MEACTNLAGRQHTAQVFRVELDSHEPWVVLNLDDLHALTLNVLANEGKSSFLELMDDGRVDFVTMPMSLGDLCCRSVQRPELRPLGVLLENARVLSETHGAAEVNLVDLE